MSLLTLPRPAVIEAVIAQWAKANPAFLWAPTTPGTQLRDRVTGLVGSQADGVITFPTTLGLGNSTPFGGVMLATVEGAPAASMGPILLIGNGNNGVGLAAGIGNWGYPGDNLVLLQGGLAWNSGGGGESYSGAFARGLNVFSFGQSADAGLIFRNETTGRQVSANQAYYAPNQVQIYRKGTADAPIVAHAVAIYEGGLSGAQLSTESARLAGYAAPFAGKSRSAVTALFRPGTQRIWVPMSAGGGAGTSLTSVTGHCSLTGYAPAIAQPRAIAGAVGHAAFAGYPAAVAQARSIAAVTGHGSFAGYTPAIGQLRALSSVVGHAVWTGRVATITQAAGTSIVGVTGHAVFTGRAATLAQPHALAGAAGHAVYAGYAATVDRSSGTSVVTVTGHAAFTGRTPGITQPRGITSATGHAALTGYSATVVRASSVAAVAGHAMFGGYAPSIAQPRSIAAITGHAALSGYVASITRAAASPNLMPGVGHAALSGYVAAVQIGGAVAVVGEPGPVDVLWRLGAEPRIWQLPAERRIWRIRR